MVTRFSGYGCGLGLLLISGWCAAAAPAPGQWAERPFALDATLGSATPVGNVGAWLDVAPVRWGSLYAGAGANLSGLQLAGMARVRFTPGRKDSVYLGAGYSRGAFSQSRWNRFGFLSIPDGAYDQMLADHSPTPGRHWKLAHWANLELGGELRQVTGFDARGFGGVGLLLNPHDNTVEAPQGPSAPGPRAVVPVVVYMGIAVGFAL